MSKETIRELLERKLKEAVSMGPGTGEIVVASKDGFTVASTIPEENKQYADELSAYATQIVKQVKDILGEMGFTSPRYIRIKTEDGTELNIYIKGNKIVIYVKRAFSSKE